MAREWTDLLVLPETAPGVAGEEEEEGRRRRGFLRRLRTSLRATRGAVFARSLASHDWEGLEEALILADVGAGAAVEIVGRLERIARTERLAEDELPERLAAVLAEIARGGDGDGGGDAGGAAARIDLRAQPAVLLMVGVNGTGKTTTVGKLAWVLREQFGLRVLLGAADTYRAAATEQLEAWAERAG